VTEEAPALGPVEFVIVHFEQGKFEGSVLNELAALEKKEIVRVLDLMAVYRTVDGELAYLDYRGLADLGDVDLGIIDGDLLDLLSEDDAAALGADLEPGETIGVLVVEDIWAKNLQTAIGGAGGRLVEASRVPADVVAAALEYHLANKELAAEA